MCNSRMKSNSFKSGQGSHIVHCEPQIAHLHLSKIERLLRPAQRCTFPQEYNTECTHQVLLQQSFSVKPYYGSTWTSWKYQFSIRYISGTYFQKYTFKCTKNPRLACTYRCTLTYICRYIFLTKYIPGNNKSYLRMYPRYWVHTKYVPGRVLLDEPDNGLYSVLSLDSVFEIGRELAILWYFE